MKALATAKAQDIAALFVVLADEAKTTGSDKNTDQWQVVQTPAMQALRADKQP